MGSTLSMREQIEVQYLAQGHLGMQMGKTGIEPPTFWLEDDRSTSFSNTLHSQLVVEL